MAGANNRLMATDIFYVDTPERKPIVLYMHGFNGFKDWGNFGLLAQRWADAGFVVISFNFSHNGTTLAVPDELIDMEAYGHNNYSKECYDTRCMLDFIYSDQFPIPEHIRLDRLWLLGHSRGGGIAIVMATDSRVYGLMTWAAVAELKTPWTNYSKEKMAQWEADGVVYYTNQRTGINYPLYYQLYLDYIQHQEFLDVQGSLAGLKKPVLLSHGRNDMAVSIVQALTLQGCKPEATLFVIDSDHVFGRKHPAEAGPLPVPMQQVLDRCILFCQENGE